jgi:hypothetical protein
LAIAPPGTEGGVVSGIVTQAAFDCSERLPAGSKARTA